MTFSQLVVSSASGDDGYSPAATATATTAPASLQSIPRTCALRENSERNASRRDIGNGRCARSEMREASPTQRAQQGGKRGQEKSQY